MARRSATAAMLAGGTDRLQSDVPFLGITPHLRTRAGPSPRHRTGLSMVIVAPCALLWLSVNLRPTTPFFSSSFLVQSSSARLWCSIYFEEQSAPRRRRDPVLPDVPICVRRLGPSCLPSSAARRSNCRLICLLHAHVDDTPPGGTHQPQRHTTPRSFLLLLGAVLPMAGR